MTTQNSIFLEREWLEELVKAQAEKLLGPVHNQYFEVAFHYNEEGWLSGASATVRRVS